MPSEAASCLLGVEIAISSSTNPMTQSRDGLKSIPLVLPLIGVTFIVALNFVRQLPEVHSLDALAFGDPGLALAVDAMLDEGRVPTEDFAYFYGLLGVAIDRAWYATFGRTAAADTAILAACNLLIGFGLVRFGSAVGLPRSTWWLLIAGVPVAVMPLRYTSPTHAMDAAIIVHALAFQARGKSRSALALAVLGAFVKSALASVYAVWLLGLILFGPRVGVSSWRVRGRDLIPATLVGLALAGLLIVGFGWMPLIKTLFPLAGAKTYVGERYGFFFGVGRDFWLRRPFDPVYYLFGPAGFWILATTILFAGIPNLLRDRRDPRAAAILTCAFLHLIFLCFLFGNEQSWLYYSFLPVLGACGVISRWEASGTCPRWLRLGLPAIAVCGWVGFAAHGFAIWKENVRTTATGGLFSRPEDAAAWERVRENGARERVLILTPSGAGRGLFPELDSIRSSALLPAVATPTELAGLLARLRHADAIVLHVATASLFEGWPTFAAELAAFEDDPAASTASFRILRRPRSRIPSIVGSGR